MRTRGKKILELRAAGDHVAHRILSMTVRGRHFGNREVKPGPRLNLHSSVARFAGSCFALRPKLIHLLFG